MQPAQWKVGDLAARTGVSVRTLHHYEEIGLLVPSGRSESGHRLYGERDVARLQQVLSLRQIGFSLDEIGDCLNRPDFSPLRVIEMHVRAVREQIGLQQRLLSRLEAIEATLKEAGSVSARELLETIEVITMFEKYYSKDQLEQLKKRREVVGDQRIQEVQREWKEIFRLYREAMEKGTDPEDEEVQALARRSAGLIGEFTGGDPGIEKSLRNLYRDQPDFAEQFGYGSGPELRGYMARASQALRKAQG